MYAALVKKDSSFEGIFFAAIKTTGIFCRPTCHARKPKAENVEYFSNSKDALDHGYRPCKVCEPMEMKGVAPDWLKSLLDEIAKTPNIRINDQKLRDKGLDPTRVRRWFKKNHGMTFQSYLRSLRINNAFGQIREGDQVIQSAYSNGFESLSGFLDSFKNSTGFTPKESKNKNIISVTRIPTPLGPMIAGATEKGICLLEFTDRRMIETQIERLRKYLKAELIPGQNQYFKQLTEELKQYFDGQLKEFNVPLELPGTPFQQQVWNQLKSIPYGQTRSYKDQAIAMDKLKAIRAVATANGDNRISIIIPCHRVIGSDGSMTGYGGGIWRKQKLLDLERKNS